MQLLRTRNHELDQLRTTYPLFNRSWLLFFGTCPPGIHRSGVFFTEEERADLAREVQTFAGGAGSQYVESYDPTVHNTKERRGNDNLGRVYGRR